MKYALLSLLLAGVAYADEPAPTQPPVEQPAAAPPLAEPPPPARPPVVVEPPPAAPAPPPAAPAPVAATPHVDSTPPDDYYSRTRGVGIFHNARLYVDILRGMAPNIMDGVASGMKDSTLYGLGFDGVYLGLPSSFGNFHGIEFSGGVRAGEPYDLWLTVGTAVTLLNIGHGSAGSIRIGGGFGFGFDLAHGFGYVRGRAAVVIVPRTLDIEGSISWSPTEASTGNYEERDMRVSAWYRPGKSMRAYELYVHAFRRVDDTKEDEYEFDGIGGGIGTTLF